MRNNNIDTSHFDFNMMSQEGIEANLKDACRSIMKNVIDMDFSAAIHSFMEKGGYNSHKSFEENKKECISYLAYKCAFSKQR